MSFARVKTLINFLHNAYVLPVGCRTIVCLEYRTTEYRNDYQVALYTLMMNPIKFNNQVPDATKVNWYHSKIGDTIVGKNNELLVWGPSDAISQYSFIAHHKENQMCDGEILEGIDRYHKFMDMIEEYPGKIMVPTMDINTVWCSELLDHGLYVDTCMKRFGCIIHHNDKIEKKKLFESFKHTSDLFMSKFGIPYQPLPMYAGVNTKNNFIASECCVCGQSCALCRST